MTRRKTREYRLVHSGKRSRGRIEHGGEKLQDVLPIGYKTHGDPCKHDEITNAEKKPPTWECIKSRKLLGFMFDRKGKMKLGLKEDNTEAEEVIR